MVVFRGTVTRLRPSVGRAKQETDCGIPRKLYVRKMRRKSLGYAALPGSRTDFLGILELHALKISEQNYYWAMRRLFMGNQATTGGSWRMIINILLLILGIIFLAAPSTALQGITITLGILLIIYAGIMIATREINKVRGQAYSSLTWPIIWLAAGILLLVFVGPVSAWLLPLIIGIWMIVLGILNLRSSHQIHAIGAKTGPFATILAIAEIILGVLSLCSMASNGAGLGIMIGICMLIYGICAVVSWAVNYVTLKRG